MSEIKVTFDAGDDYERFMGRWSRAIGERFIAWLAPPQGASWLDVGCGTGAFTQMVAKHCAPAAITGIDPAPAQIEHARKHISAPNIDFQVADAMSLPIADDAFDIVTSALVINFIPDRAKALSEMHRVLKPGGTVTAYLWNRDQSTDFSPHAPMEQGLRKIGAEPMRPPLSPEAAPAGAQAALSKAGFADIVVTTIEAPQTYRDFDDYWQAQTVPFAPIGKSVAALSEDQREKLRETMRSILPAASDGRISYSSRAVAFKARKAD
jgi:ubiquinone/menaquinone biosynthesis C-methylase UbiE